MNPSLKDWLLIKKSLIIQVDSVNNQIIEKINDQPEHDNKIFHLKEEKKRLLGLIERIRKEIDFQ